MLGSPASHHFIACMLRTWSCDALKGFASRGQPCLLQHVEIVAVIASVDNFAVSKKLVFVGNQTLEPACRVWAACMGVMRRSVPWEW